MSQLQQLQQYQALQQFMQRNTFEQLQSQSQPPVQLEDDDEEVVPESPPQELTRKKNKGKGKKVVEPETAEKPKRSGRPWTKVEEEALAMAYVKASTCPIVGNNQSGTSFWRKTTERFNAIMEHGPARDIESVSAKWRKMIKVVNAFNQIYNQIYLNPPSGSNEADILNLAIAKWDSENSTPFPHFRAWKVVSKEQKWKPIPNEVATAKRTKTSESGSYSAGGSTARCQIDINDDPEDDEDVLPVHESERPPGRDKAKKEAAAKRKVAGSSGGGGSSGGRGEKASSKMDDLISEFRSFKQFAAEKYSHKKNVSSDYARAEDFRIMRLDLDSVPEDEREVYRRMKEEVKKKWTS
ncbi:glutathione S-transferase T3-like [Helianthus annuus]|uniref:glutathione S-transferase T3-like n=1 Tax=Helianthus annuus TaxID=4232 RepID=UPI0016532913|nr:glutathione S-transferase T3-like [Helianthus annuus]